MSVKVGTVWELFVSDWLLAEVTLELTVVAEKVVVVVDWVLVVVVVAVVDASEGTKLGSNSFNMLSEIPWFRKEPYVSRFKGLVGLFSVVVFVVTTGFGVSGDFFCTTNTIFFFSLSHTIVGFAKAISVLPFTPRQINFFISPSG